MYCNIWLYLHLEPQKALWEVRMDLSDRELSISVVSGEPFPSVLFRCREALFLIFELLPLPWEHNFIFSLMSFLNEKVIIPVIQPEVLRCL